MTWMEYVARMGDTRNAYKILVREETTCYSYA